MANPLILAEHGRFLILPPGFRFHPTDEELVVEYLKKKAYGLPLPSSSAIADCVNLETCDPWYLPGILDGESYFFTLKEVKPRAKIVAPSGYWKATGKEMQITVNGHLVGMKKALNFYRDGRRTDWIMHEYRLAGVRFHHQKWCSVNMMNDNKYWVACRVSKKKRGNAAYGADHEGGRAPSSPTSSCVTDN